MTDFSVCTMGAVKLSKDTGAVIAQCGDKLEEGDSEEVEPFGDLDMAQCLGIAAVPAPADDNGAAEAVVAESIAGAVGVVVGGRDTRTADVVGQIAAGETALHATGVDFDSRVLCKDQSLSLIVGDDMVVTLNRKEKTINIAGFGHIFEMSEKQGIQLAESGGARISLQNGAVVIDGTSITLGSTALGPASGVAYGPPPTIPLVSKPSSTKVFVAP